MLRIMKEFISIKKHTSFLVTVIRNGGQHVLKEAHELHEISSYHLKLHVVLSKE